MEWEIKQLLVFALRKSAGADELSNEIVAKKQYSAIYCHLNNFILSHSHLLPFANRTLNLGAGTFCDNLVSIKHQAE